MALGNLGELFVSINGQASEFYQTLSRVKERALETKDDIESGDGIEIGGNAGAAGGGFAEIGQQMRAAIQSGLAPLSSMGTKITAMMDVIGGAIVTHFRRIEDHMKFEVAIAAVQKFRDKMKESIADASNKSVADLTRVERVVLRLGPAAIAAASGFLAFKQIKSWISSLGDVAARPLSLMKGFEKITLGSPIAGAQKLGGAFKSVHAPIERASQSVRALGAEIAIALGLFGLGYKLVEFFKGGIKGASDLNEILSRTQVIFGDSAKVITDKAEELSKVGVVKAEFIDAASKIGGALRGTGGSADEAAKLGTQFAKLTADLVSFDGTVSNEEGFSALKAAIRGEFDPLERLGIYLSMDAVKAAALTSGLIKQGQELTGHAKQIAILNEIKRQGAFADGDLERTASSTANQFRKTSGGISNFATSIGQVLLPAVNSAVLAFNDLLASVIEVFETNRPTITAWADNLKSAFDIVGVAVRNMDIMWEVSKLKFLEFGANILDVLDTLPENFGRITEWIGRNWWDLLKDLISADIAIFTNLIENAKDFGIAFWEAIQGKGFHFDPTPLLEGFKRTAEAFPEMLAPTFTSMQAEIDRLTNKIAEREAKRPQMQAAGEKKQVEKNPEKPEKAKQGEFTDFAAFAQKLQLGVFGKDATVTAIGDLKGGVVGQLKEIKQAIKGKAAEPGFAVGEA